MTSHANRRSATVDSLSLAPGQVFVTLDLPTIRYLTGFSGSNAALALDMQGVAVATDGRYLEQIANEAPDTNVVNARDAIGGLLPLLQGRHVLLDDRTPTAVHARLVAAELAVETVCDPLAPVRMVKDAEERAIVSKACAITAQALMETFREIREGDTEIHVARRLEAHFGKLGAHDRAFPTIVGSGPNAAIPHHRAGARQLTPGDLVVIDCGAMVDGYHADMTRTFIVGADPEPWQAEIHAVVERAQSAAIAALKVGQETVAIDSAARSVVAGAGFEEFFTHGTGHGIGLQIHEEPMISRTGEGVIEQGCIVTIEPGIYLPGRGGVRIEDSVAVGQRVQVLTEAPRGLTRVG